MLSIQIQFALDFLPTFSFKGITAVRNVNFLKFNQDSIFFFLSQPPLSNNVEMKLIFVTLLSDIHIISITFYV